MKNSPFKVLVIYLLIFGGLYMLVSICMFLGLMSLRKPKPKKYKVSEIHEPTKKTLKVYETYNGYEELK